jgi:ABC-2 type transport system ATP-binding protein
MNEITAIELNNVSKVFGKKEVVKNISLTINKGEIVTILGPNGAGKTTTINIMLGILNPTKGYVLLNSHNPQKPNNRQCLGAMLQHTGLPDTLTPNELIELWQSYYLNPLKKEEIIETAGITDILNVRFGKLSGGQKRKIAFALAISGNPDILFLDEPSTGLDIDARGLLWKQIKKLNLLNKTIVLCTHYLEEADALSNRIVLMNKGEIVEDDTPLNIKRKVAYKTIQFKPSISFEQLKQAIPLEKIIMEDRFIKIKTNTPETQLQKIFQVDKHIQDLQVKEINLEEAFIQLTTK